MEELLAFPFAQANPSPLPTTAPHPRNVNARLLAARQLVPETCAYANADIAESITCSIGRKCVELTSYNVFGCCLSASFPNNCGTGQTSCVAYENIGSCTGSCANNPAVVQCSDADFPVCGVTVYDFSTLTHLLTGFSCAPASTRVTAYPYYSLDGDANDLSTAASIAAATVTVTASNNNTDTGGDVGGGAATTPSPTLPGPVPAAASNTSAPPNGGGGLSAGAKAGIAIGAVAAAAIIAALIFFIFYQKRRHDRQRKQTMPAGGINPTPQQGPPPMGQYPPQQQQMQQQQQQPLGSPNPMMQNNQAHTSMASMPASNTSSGAPLTQGNLAAMSHPHGSTGGAPASEVLPSESASQINGPQGGSVLSGAGYNNPGNVPAGGSGTGTGTGSQEHSGLGSLPQYPTGPSAFPHAQASHPGQSVLSAPSAFGSAPPVHAPSVAPYQGEQR